MGASSSPKIVLFGAEFTRLYTMRIGSNILTSEGAVRIVPQTVETSETPVSNE